MCTYFQQIGGKIWSLTHTVAVFINDEYLGNEVEFFYYISQDYIFSLPFEIEYYENLAIECCKRFMEKSKVNCSLLIIKNFICLFCMIEFNDINCILI